ncbi:MAG: riboflavin kinase / adenylyltransferase [Clostridia bacterium]|nr:riboflavin kinase / adenylyltransferase [Clostridia bacterium]
MQVWNGLPEKASLKGCCIALGNFDGVHLGHQSLINSMVQKAEISGGKAVVITFNPHPVEVLEGRSPGLLTTPKQKVRLIASLGVEHLFLLPFTKELAVLEPDTFVKDILWFCYRPRLITVGFNFTFGNKGLGTPKLLRKLGEKFNFKVDVVPPVTHKGVTVSSTTIRNALENGNITLAKDLLGYWPTFSGKVVAGDQRGRKLGFPTANVEVLPQMKIPAYGVYACFAKVNGMKQKAMVNIGRRPTFGSALPATIEAHLIDFEDNLYGQEIELEFRAYLRPEQKFPSVEELKAQLSKDKEMARQILLGDRDLIFFGNRQA